MSQMIYDQQPQMPGVGCAASSTRWMAWNGGNMSHPSEWARLLLERDPRQGRKVLERMVQFYEENDGKADDFGRLFIVTDAERALEETA